MYYLTEDGLLFGIREPIQVISSVPAPGGRLVCGRRLSDNAVLCVHYIPWPPNPHP